MSKLKAYNGITEFNSFEEAYISTLYEVLEHGKERAENKDIEHFGIDFQVIPQKPEVFDTMFTDIKIRKFKIDFAKKFAAWILNGGTDISELYEYNSNAKNFNASNENQGRSTAYGPRIQKQLLDILEELQTSPESKRCTFLILESDDQEIRQLKRTIGTKTEYPCSIGTTVWRSDNQLHMHTILRSNNVTTTLCYDLYNFYALQKYLADQLNLKIGTYRHTATNMHVVASELQLALQILGANIPEWH